MAVALSGCAVDPAMPLIPTPTQKATILPSEAPERTADGFANILADPATVGGLPRSQRVIAAEESALKADAARTAAAGRSIRTTGSVSALEARGRNHVAEARAEIERNGRVQTEEHARTVSGAAAPPAAGAASAPATAATSAAAPAEDPGVPLDPDAPPPRAVGVAPFAGTGVAPAR